MVAIVLSNFSGEQPRVLKRLMPDNAAQSAINVRLDDGGLTPMQYSATETGGDPDYQSIFNFNGTWLGWDVPVNAAPGPVATDRLYYTGDGAPKMRVGSTVYDLAITRPSAALTLALGGTGSGDVYSRLYVYTWVTDYGEESEPSPASAAIDWQDGNTVTLSGFDATPAGRAITKQRIYRSQSGKSGTFFYFIAERAASASDYVDSISVDDFAEPLPSLDYNAPPADLEGLISLPNGMMAAFVGKKVYFCEPFRPHAWPEKYVLTTDYAVVALGAVGDAMVILTTGQPYMCAGSAPEVMQTKKIEQNLPCINARAVVDLGYAIAFPTHEGLAVIDASGGISIPTVNIFSRQSWLDLSPSTMVAGQISGRYAAFYDTIADDGSTLRGMLLINTGGGGFLARMDIFTKACWHSIETSLLYYVDPTTGEIRIANAPNGARLNLYWKSKEFVTPQPINMSAILIEAVSNITQREIDLVAAAIAAIEAENDAIVLAGFTYGPVGSTTIAYSTIAADDRRPVPSPLTLTMNVNVFADGVLVASVTDIGKIKRLPGGYTARKWEIDVFTNFTVERIAMATSVDELKQLA